MKRGRDKRANDKRRLADFHRGEYESWEQWGLHARKAVNLNLKKYFGKMK